jgi:hypothetical protein
MGESHVLYTGNVEIERGVLQHIEGIRQASEVHLHLIGRTYHELSIKHWMLKKE